MPDPHRRFDVLRCGPSVLGRKSPYSMRLNRAAIVTTAIVLLSAGVVWLAKSRAATDDLTVLSQTAPQGSGVQRYVDRVRGFFFDYPIELSLTETDDGDDSHAIFGDTANGETRLMVVASPYVLDTPLTEEIIRDQVPNITFSIDRMPLPSVITAFLGRRAENPLGATRDAFFVHDGIVYQISVVDDFDDDFTEVLTSLRFASPPSL